MLDTLHCQGSLNSSLALLEQVGGYKWPRYLEQLERTSNGVTIVVKSECHSLNHMDRICRNIHFVSSKQVMFACTVFY